MAAEAEAVKAVDEVGEVAQASAEWAAATVGVAATVVEVQGTAAGLEVILVVLGVEIGSRGLPTDRWLWRLLPPRTLRESTGCPHPQHQSA